MILSLYFLSLRNGEPPVSAQLNISLLLFENKKLDFTVETEKSITMLAFDKGGFVIEL